MVQPDARDVIAHLLHERHPLAYPVPLSPFDDSDAILAALHDAGVAVIGDAEFSRAVQMIDLTDRTDVGVFIGTNGVVEITLSGFAKREDQP